MFPSSIPLMGATKLVALFFITLKNQDNMEMQKASRKNAKIKMALQGPSGSGKTFSALLLAYGLCGDWSKIVVIDTENRSADLYSHLGDYLTLPLSAPYHPEKYIEAIAVCEKGGMQVIIIDSISHEWEGSGGILDLHGNMTGNSFTNWAKLTPRHNGFIQAILQSPCHIIGTMRTKQDYVLSERNGKQVPEKVGLKAIQRDGLEYDFTLVFDLDIKNNATASKDRTGLFFGKPGHILLPPTAHKILEWCNSGIQVSVDAVSERINDCRSLSELLQLYKQFPQYNGSLQSAFEQRKRHLIINQGVKDQLTHLPINNNGTSH
jgi:hypothetical protein